MKTPFLKVAALGVLLAGLAGLPQRLPAQTNASARKPSQAEKAADINQTGEKKARSLPFRGKLKAVDKLAKTLMIGTRTFQITSRTRIFRGEQPALLEDGLLGESVTGSYLTGPDGKLVANTVYFGGKSGASSGKKPTEKQAEKRNQEGK